jgi:hypothetical protein
MSCRALLTGLLLASAAVACTPDDTTLTVQVQSRVNRVMGPDSSVDVTVRGGVATLSGVASGEATRQRAEEAARSVAGVRAVNDEITVPSTSGTTHTTGGTVPAPGPSSMPPGP